ncbi:MAG TPA: prephenate dehydrogenase/arogenate dehydrogenase family protein [Acidobacteriaceae bacterium]|jgi:prephenate dehydrogenase|nr:prephenate dehydrogenase/arogenate dehydrogenase family protein [Acidobacteriaceae bacterium]
MKKVLIVGTGLIGASVGLALKANGFEGEVSGWDANAEELKKALECKAIDRALERREAVLETDADVVVLATPVLPILDWMQQLAPKLKETQLVTDVGSTKGEITALAGKLFNQPEGSQAGRARFLPGHPMAGKESGGAALAEADLFRGATWLFCAGEGWVPGGELEMEWRKAVVRMGAVMREMDPARHDEVCAWVSHLPQMLATALSAELEDRFAGDREGMAAVQAIGGRALREMTRLGASPYSMWRDVAMTNPKAIAETLAAMEQRLAHVRENLKTPELRDEFAKANKFRATRG